MLSIGIGARSRHAEPDHSKRRQAISKGGTEGPQTLRWREMDSNFRFRVPCKGRKAIIAGFGCMPPSVDYLRLPSVDITQGGLSEISEPKPYRAQNRKFESISLQRRVSCKPEDDSNIELG